MVYTSHSETDVSFAANVRETIIDERQFTLIDTSRLGPAVMKPLPPLAHLFVPALPIE